jgi:hypothetical protein
MLFIDERRTRFLGDLAGKLLKRFKKYDLLWFYYFVFFHQNYKFILMIYLGKMLLVNSNDERHKVFIGCIQHMRR